MDYMDHDAHCPDKAVKLNHSTHPNTILLDVTRAASLELAYQIWQIS